MAYKGNQTTWDNFAPSLQQKLDEESKDINQKVDGLKTEVNEHLAKSVASEDGAHDLRYLDDKLEINDGTNWTKIKTGGDLFGIAESTDGVTYSVVLDGVSEYVVGMSISIKPNKISTVRQVKIQVNNLAPVPITHANSDFPIEGLIRANSIYTLRFSGDRFIIQGDGFGLLDSVNSATTLYAATANAVKQVNDKVSATPIILTPNAPFVVESSGELAVGKAGNVAVLAFKVKTTQQLATTSQYQMCEILPVGYRNLRATVVGHGFCWVSSVARLIPVTIASGTVIMQAPPIAIPANTYIEGNITFYVG